MYYLNYLVKNQKNKEKLQKDFSEIIKTQEPILHQEDWNIHNMNQKLKDSQRNSTPCFEFDVYSHQRIHYPRRISP
jgi:hypothetical protein